MAQREYLSEAGPYVEAMRTVRGAKNLFFALLVIAYVAKCLPVPRNHALVAPPYQIALVASVTQRSVVYESDCSTHRYQLPLTVITKYIINFIE